MVRAISTLLLLATLLAACAADPMASYYACRKSGIGSETCPGRMSVGHDIARDREPG